MAEVVEERDGNPFRRSGNVNRTPNGGTVTQTATPANVVDGQTADENNVSSFCNLGQQIRKLVDMLEDGKRRSIHQPMRDAIEKIRALFELVAIEQQDEQAKSVIRKNAASQTTPGLNKCEAQTARRENERAKRAKGQRAARQESGQAVDDETPSTSAAAIESIERQKHQRNEEWTKVQKKKRKTTEKRGRTRPDALIISANNETSYADILRKIKSDDSLKALGENVKAIRRTASNGLLLELRKNTEKSSTEFQGAVEKVLKDSAKVAAKTHAIVVQLRDLDEVTTASEICEALHSQCQIRRPDESSIRISKKGPQGTQTAFINLPALDAVRVIKQHKIRVGWVYSRVRECITPKLCYKCWGYNHIARNCSAEADRRNLCWKCGQEGHKSSKCGNPQKCAICGGNHAAGSARCTEYQKAVQCGRR